VTHLLRLPDHRAGPSGARCQHPGLVRLDCKTRVAPPQFLAPPPEGRHVPPNKGHNALTAPAASSLQGH